jgi:class 3 adenylate cyclase/HAMP domain-containing protein
MAEARAEQDRMDPNPAGNRPTGTRPAPSAERSQSGASGADLPRWASIFRPLVDAIAGIPVSVHAKLLSGFLVGALLLLAMGVLSLAILDRMNQRVDELARLQEKVDRSRQMEYLVTAQSHYRAMALLTRDSTNNDKIANAKKEFIEHLNAVERMSPPAQSDFFRQVRSANDRFADSSQKVLDLYTAGNVDEAMKLHLGQEHPVSHELEAAMLRLNADAVKDMREQRTLVTADQGLLAGMVGGFSVVSLLTALLLGFALSWAFVRPVRRMDGMLKAIAAGDFSQRLHVPNRDEFGALSKNLNTMTMHLATAYDQLRSMNSNLQQTVQEQLMHIERASALKRYLSPQLAESIIDGKLDVNLVSRRKNLTVCYIDVRGFSAMSESLQPEELVDVLNQYLTAMTEIVFRHGGTLDKYIGDAIKVFFGDPIQYEDHAGRAVQMAIEMQAKLTEMQHRWSVSQDEFLTMGIGISTGYVTVGNIGSSTRQDYTVIGNHVNLASRLADRAKAGQILVSERTLLAVRSLVESREIDEVELEGVARPIKIYEIRATRAEISAPSLARDGI